MIDNKYFNALSEDYIKFKRNMLIEGIEYDLYTEEEKKSMLGIIIDKIKKLVKNIIDWIASVWKKFVSKFRNEPKVAKADQKIKQIESKIKSDANRANENNAEQIYETVSKEAEEVRDVANEAINEVKKRKAGNAQGPGKFSDKTKVRWQYISNSFEIRSEKKGLNTGEPFLRIYWNIKAVKDDEKETTVYSKHLISLENESYTKEDTEEAMKEIDAKFSESSNKLFDKNQLKSISNMVKNKVKQEINKAKH